MLKDCHISFTGYKHWEAKITWRMVLLLLDKDYVTDKTSIIVQ